MTSIATTLTLATVATLAAACASAPPALPAGVTAGRFVPMECAENRQFQVRVSEDGKSARVRALHGSAELERTADGLYAADGYTLRLAGEGAISLDHDGKSQGRGCKPRG